MCALWPQNTSCWVHLRYECVSPHIHTQNGDDEPTHKSAHTYRLIHMSLSYCWTHLHKFVYEFQFVFFSLFVHILKDCARIVWMFVPSLCIVFVYVSSCKDTSELVVFLPNFRAYVLRHIMRRTMNNEHETPINGTLDCRFIDNIFKSWMWNARAKFNEKKDIRK